MKKCFVFDLWQWLTAFSELDLRRSQSVKLYQELKQILPNSWTGLTNCLRDPNGSLDAAIHPLFFNAGPTGLGFRKQHWLQRKVSLSSLLPPPSLPPPLPPSFTFFLPNLSASLDWLTWTPQERQKVEAGGTSGDFIHVKCTVPVFPHWLALRQSRHTSFYSHEGSWSVCKTQIKRNAKPTWPQVKNAFWDSVYLFVTVTWLISCINISHEWVKIVNF